MVPVGLGANAMPFKVYVGGIVILRGKITS